MKRVLIAEDDKFIANAYRAKLEKAGFELQMAGDGEEVLRILEVWVPDLILMDLIMPKRDGFSALEEIKKNPKWKSIPVLVASNLGQKEDVDRAEELGADGYIVKSNMGINDLVTKINSLLG